MDRLGLKQPNLGRLLESKLAVLAVDALSVDGLPACFYLYLRFDQVLCVDLARANQGQDEGLVRWMNFLDLKIN